MLEALKARWRHLAAGKRPGETGRSDRAWGARAPLIASILLGVAIAAQGAQITFELIADFKAVATAGPGAARGAHPRQRAAALSTLNNVVSAHLFGIAPTLAAARSVAAARMPLVLTGIIATEDPSDGFAILGASAASTHVFHTGAQTAPGTILVEVYPQRVVLLRDGERLTLILPKTAASAPLDGSSANVRLAQSGAAPVATRIGGSGMVQEPPPGSFKPPPLSDASALMRAFSMRPVSIGGHRGVRIMGTGMNSKTLAALGLAPGDIILQINGVPIGGRHTPDLAGALKSGSATLVVDRNGDATSVTIDPGSAAAAAADYRQAAPDL